MNNLKQLETREVNVGENIFYIRPLPAFKAANMTGELAALVLPKKQKKRRMEKLLYFKL